MRSSYETYIENYKLPEGCSLYYINKDDFELIEEESTENPILSHLNKIILEIETEIGRNSTKPNMGKKGCLRRLYELKETLTKNI